MNSFSGSLARFRKDDSWRSIYAAAGSITRFLTLLLTNIRIYPRPDFHYWPHCEHHMIMNCFALATIGRAYIDSREAT